jgi:hypothetical protein
MWWMGAGPEPKQALQNCVVRGPGQTKQQIFLLGDSHTGNFQAWMDTITSRSGLALIHAYAGGQSIPVIPSPKDPANIKFKDAEQQTKFINLVLDRLQPHDLIIVSSYLLQQFRTDALRTAPSSHPGRSRWQAWQDELEVLIQRVQSKGAYLVITQPPPDFRLMNGWQSVTNENCTLQWFRPSLNKACLYQRPRQEILDEIAPIAQGLETLSKSHDYFFVYNPFPKLCPPQLTICSNYLEGRRTFIDYSHLTRAGSAFLVHDFDAFLKSHQLLLQPPGAQSLKGPQ